MEPRGAGVVKMGQGRSRCSIPPLTTKTVSPSCLFSDIGQLS